MNIKAFTLCVSVLQDLSKTSLGLKGETSLKLVDKNEKEWAVKCNENGVLGLGWINFACAHNLDEGDVCVFETINAEDRSLRVHTFRVSDIIDHERQDGVKILLISSHLEIEMPCLLHGHQSFRAHD